MILISVNKLEKYLDTNKIFDDITFNIYNGEKVGIVGDNGCGKSTLLKILCGLIELSREDKGDIFITKGASISYLEQMPHYEEKTKVKDVLNMAFEKVRNAEKKMKELEKKIPTLKDNELEKTLREYNRIQEFYEANDGYKIEEKLNRICIGLNINDEFLNKDFSLLSGGEKTTVVLGKILLENPDVLLLDEPTNHLDMQSCEWLEGFLKSYKGIVVIVSHDRYFLDNVVNKIIEIDNKISTTYKGNYSQYLKEREENLLLEFNAYKEQQKKIEAMEAAIKKLRDWASRGDNAKFFRRAASMQKALDKIKVIEKPKLEKDKIKLNFNETERSGNEVLKIEGLSKAYSDKILLKEADLFIRYKERVGVIGKNGCGKTTLLRMILNEEDYESGNIKIGDSVKLSYLSQNITFEDEELTIIEEFRKNIVMGEGEARGYLSKYMFYGSDVFKKIRHLSGGERIRLKLSEMLYNDINLLILDEPTNHLDINSIETLEEALNNFKGTILFISHDRYFLNKMSDRIVAFENCKLNSYAGNYDYYKNIKDNERKSENAQKEVIEESRSKEQWKQSKEKDRELRKIKNGITRAEKEISNLEQEIKDIENLMNNNASNYEKLKELTENKELLEKTLEDKMNAWEALTEQLDTYEQK